MIALFIIATGPRYWQYIAPLLDSAERHLKVPFGAILFTDAPEGLSRHGYVHRFQVQPKGYPQETLHRYHTILSQEVLLTQYSHVFYIDVDMLFYNDVGEEILSDGITATLHAGYYRPYYNNGFSNGTWEERPQSTAYVPKGQGRQYFAGGFNGGTRQAYLEMARVISRNVDLDNQKGLTALWHDESHLNRYLWERPPAKVLCPSYCYPEHESVMNTPSRYYEFVWKNSGIEFPTPKILALEKRHRP